MRYCGLLPDQSVGLAVGDGEDPARKRQTPVSKGRLVNLEKQPFILL